MRRRLLIIHYVLRRNDDHQQMQNTFNGPEKTEVLLKFGVYLNRFFRKSAEVSGCHSYLLKNELCEMSSNETRFCQGQVGPSINRR